VRMRRLAAPAALLVSVGLATPAVAATAADSSGTVIYVDSGLADCSDSGTGTASTPFCTIQAGVDAAAAGDTVEVTGSREYRYATTTVSVSGTASEPITIEAAPGTTPLLSQIADPTTAPAFTISGASHVTIRGFSITGDIPQFAEVTSSSDITLDQDGSQDDGAWTPDEEEPFVEVAGSSSAVTVSRSTINYVAFGTASAVQIDAGSSDDVVAGNVIEDDTASQAQEAFISVSGAPGTAVTGNTVIGSNSCAPTISLGGASTGSTIENNILYTASYYCAGNSAILSIAQAATSGTTVGYNIFYGMLSAGDEPVLYQWAGTSYTTVAAFQAASGQGSQDEYADPQFGDGFEPSSTSPAVNSANSAAPGALGTDLDGDACSYDPYVAVTGAGDPAYCSRGAFQYQGPALSAALDTETLGALEVATDDAQPPVDAQGYAYNWGDGQTTNSTTADAAHTYATPGTYTITETVTDQLGGTASTSTTYTTEGTDFTSYGPARLLDTRSAIGGTQGPIPSGGVVKLKIAGNGTIPDDVSVVVLNLTAVDGTNHGVITAYADGASAPDVSNVNYGAATVANEAIVPVGADGYIDLLNAGVNASTRVDMLADVTGYFTATTSSVFDDVDPTRILDTRKGLGASKAKVGSESSISLTIDGAGSGTLPASGITAVSLHVTAVDAAANGYVTVYPAGQTRPGVSNLNFSTGSTVSNTVIVPVGSDGKIDLYNGSPSGSVDLIADVAGYYTTTFGVNSGVFVPVAPYRELDTRKTTALSHDGSVTFNPYGSSHQLADPGDSYVMNLTVVQSTANGYITVYPAGEDIPGVSSVNYLPGQTVANLAQVGAGGGGGGTVTITNSEESGTVEVIADVFGYYTHDY
jgi:PKD domain